MKTKTALGKWIYALAPFIMLVLVFVALQVVVRAFGIPSYLMASPTDSFLYIVHNFDRVAQNCAVSLKNYLIGYPLGIILGMTLAFIFSSHVKIKKAFQPYLTLLSCVPGMILVPLFKIWFGLSEIVNVLICMLSCFSTICGNTMLGMSNVPEERMELVKTVKGSKLQAFTHIVIPSALPYVFTGLKLGSIFALSGVIGSELVGSMRGIGYEISWDNAFFHIDALFGYVYILMVLGFVVFSLLSALETRLLHND